MEERYDSILFEPIDDKGILEGMVLWTLNNWALMRKAWPCSAGSLSAAGICM